MASRSNKRKRRRPNAGPPPAAAKRAAESKPAERAPKRRPGEPIPPSFKGVLIRSVIVAVIFYPVLVYVADESPGAAAAVSLIAFLLMLPFGLLLDRSRYRMQMRRYERARAGRTSP